MKAERAATHPEARLASTTINPPRIAPTVGMKASSPAWMPRMNELWMPMIDSPIQVTRNTATMVMICAISQRSSLADPVDDRDCPRPVSRRCHEQQSVAVDGWLGRKRYSQKQHDEEVADRACSAQ